MGDEPLFNSRRELLVSMLLARGLAEEKPGYGHATAEKVADTVMEWVELVVANVE